MSAVALVVGWGVLANMGLVAVYMALRCLAAEYRAWRERAAIELRHRWGRECAGEWEEGEMRWVIRCNRCRARHDVIGSDARDAYLRYQIVTHELARALRQARQESAA